MRSRTVLDHFTGATDGIGKEEAICHPIENQRAVIGDARAGFDVSIGGSIAQLQDAVVDDRSAGVVVHRCEDHRAGAALGK